MARRPNIQFASVPEPPNAMTGQSRSSPPRFNARPWMSQWLIAAGVYNVVWGTLVVLAPLKWFELLDIQAPNYPALWQCIGMIVGVYGLGYLIAATDPMRHWPIVLVGLLGKILGPLGFVRAVSRQEIPWRFAAILVTNDLLWWAPFSLILLAVYRALRERSC